MVGASALAVRTFDCWCTIYVHGRHSGDSLLFEAVNCRRCEAGQRLLSQRKRINAMVRDKEQARASTFVASLMRKRPDSPLFGFSSPARLPLFVMASPIKRAWHRFNLIDYLQMPTWLS